MKTNPKKAFFALLLLACVLSVASCGKKSSSSNSYGNNGGGGGTTGTSVSIVNFSFSSANLTITKGTTVTWKNNDGVTHTVTADDGSFDSGSIVPGSSYSHTFAAAGTFAYHCNIHSTMTAKVTVQ